MKLFNFFFPLMNADPDAGGGGVPTLLDPPAGGSPAPVEGGDPAPTQEPAPIITAPNDRDWTTAINADGSFDAKAHEWGIPEHMKSVGGMFESYQNMQRMKGMPGAEATPEQISAYRQANGVPEVVNAEAYGLALPDELKDAYPEGALDSIAQAANESAHLGHIEMLKAVVEKFATMEVEGRAAQAQLTEANHAAQLAANAKALESDPNFAGTNKAGALQTAANVLNTSLDNLGVDPNSDEAKDIARSPLMVRILHNLGSRMTQDNTDLGSAPTDLRSGQDQAKDIMTNPTNPEYALYQAGDERVGKKVLSLQGIK